MPRTTTTYDLLLSCPGDVYKECFPVIEEAVNEFNGTIYAKDYGVAVNLIHWSTDSYPQSGGHPQKLLNEQIVDPADASVAVFWTRFGTPTEEYNSGTEEEIERMLAAGRQVFLYFLEKPVSPTLLGDAKAQDEYAKVLIFKERYKNNGIYWSVSDEHDLKQKLTLHLALHFLKAIGNKEGAMSNIAMPTLLITGRKGESLIPVEHTTLSSSHLIAEKYESIISEIAEAKKNTLPARSKAAEEMMEKENQLSNGPTMRMTSNFSGFKMSAKFSSDDMELITEFCNKSGITIDHDFWNLGDLNEKQVKLPYLYGGSYDDGLIGTKLEIARYKQIQKVVYSIREYNNYIRFFEAVDSLPYIELVIRNTGTSFDQDVDVSISIPPDCLLPTENFPLPKFIIEEIVDEQIIDFIVCPFPSSELAEFNDYSNDHFGGYTAGLPQINERPEDRIDRYISEYFKRIEDLYFYEMYYEEGKDILKINFAEIKQHTNILFPARLFMQKIPDSIEFSITAKYTPTVISGKLTLIQDSF